MVEMAQQRATPPLHGGGGPTAPLQPHHAAGQQRPLSPERPVSRLAAADETLGATAPAVNNKRRRGRSCAPASPQLIFPSAAGASGAAYPNQPEQQRSALSNPSAALQRPTTRWARQPQHATTRDGASASARRRRRSPSTGAGASGADLATKPATADYNEKCQCAVAVRTSLRRALPYWTPLLTTTTRSRRYKHTSLKQPTVASRCPRGNVPWALAGPKQASRLGHTGFPL